jgi:TP901 family phage tail tape measure protein
MSDVQANINIGVDTSIGIQEIKQLQRQIAQLNSQLLKSGAQQIRSADQIQRNLINNINSTGKFAANVRTISTTTEGFTNALERNKLSMGQYFKYAGASTKTFGRLFKGEFDTIEKVARERVKTLQTQFIKLGRDGSGAMKAIAVRPLALDMENLATKTAMAAQKQQLMNQLLKQGSTNLLNFGKNTQWAGRQLMVGFTVPLAYLGTIASKTFMKMEEQAIRFKRVYGDTFTATAETDKMIRQIQQLASEFTKYGVSVEKTMKMAADAAAMGKQGAELIAQVRQASTLAVLGGVEQDQALETAISLTNAFGIAAEDLGKKINFLNAVENQTVTSIEDLTIAIPKAAPVIQQLGGDVEDLAFFLTAMKEGGINASEGANALKSGLASIINPTEKASKFLQGFGINLKGLVEANKGDVKGLVVDFASALDQLDPLSKARAIEQLFGKFQFARLSTLFQNVIAQGSQAERVLKLSATTTEELAILSEREMKRIEESPMYKFKAAVEDLKVSLVPLGEAFLKAITPLVEFAKGFLDRFNGMSEGAKQFTVIATTAIAGLGPILLMSFGLIANGVANLIKMFTVIGNVFRNTGKKTLDLGSQTEYMTQQQLEASAIAASLNQTHSKLIQTFTSEASAVNQLANAYVRAQIAQSKLLGVNPRTGQPFQPGAAKGRAPKKYARGVVSVPGPKGAGDIVPAMLSPGEAIIPAKQSQKYSGLIEGMINDDIPGYRFGLNPFKFMLGRSRVAVRTKQDALVKMLQDGKGGRYKSAFETKTGADYLDIVGNRNTAQEFLRKRMEQKVFGLGPDAPISARPTYGYARTSPIQALINRLFGFKGKQYNSVTTDFPIGDRGKMFGYKDPKTGMFGPTPNFKSDTLERYGDIDLITKRSVARRSSASVSDALMDFQRGGPGFRLSPVSMRGGKGDFENARFSRLSNPFGSYKTDPINRPNEYTANPKPPYVETYTPGGFSLKEVSKIRVVDRKQAKELQKLVDQAGLRIRVTPQNAPLAIRALSNIFGTRFKMGTEGVDLQLSHLQDSMKIEGDIEKRFSTMVPQYAGLTAQQKQLVRDNTKVYGSLVAELPTWMNQRLRAKDVGIAPDTFLANWNYRQDKLTQAAILGGATETDLKTISSIEKEIGKAAAKIAKSEGVNVKDDILSRATNDVLSRHAKASGDLGRVANALLSRSSVMSEYRTSFSAPELRRLTNAGMLTVDAKGQYFLGNMIVGRTGGKSKGKAVPKGTSRQYKVDYSSGKPVKTYIEKKFLSTAVSKEALKQELAQQTGKGLVTPKTPVRTTKPKLPSKAVGLPPRAQAMANIRDYLWKKYNSGVVSVPGSGSRDTVPAMLTPGEAVIPAEMAKKYSPLIGSMIDDTIPGYAKGRRGKNNRKANFSGNVTQTRGGSKTGTVLVETNPQPGVTTQRRVSANVTQQELANVKKQLKGSPFKRAINAITTNVTGAIATGIQNANIAKVMTKDYVAGYKERFKAETAIVNRQMAERDKRVQRASQARRDAKWNQKYSEATNAKMFGPNYKDATSGRFVSADTVNSRYAQFKEDQRSQKLQAKSDARLAKDFAKFDKKYGKAGMKMVKTGGGAGYYDTVNKRLIKADEAKARMKEVNAERRSAMTGKVAGAGSVAGMAAMAYGMSGGPGAEIASMMSLPLMMLPAILPLLTNPIGIAAVAIAGLGAAAFFVNEQFKKTRDKAAELALSLGSGTKALKPIAEFAGQATATEIMARRRQSQFAPISENASKFGNVFAQSEAGKAMITNLKTAVAGTAGRAGATQSLLGQLTTSVSSGLLTSGEAIAIAQEMGKQLGDEQIALDVTTRIVEVFGIDGKNLKTNPLQVRVQLMTDAGQPLKDFMATLPTVGAGATATNTSATVVPVTGPIATGGRGYGAGSDTIGTSLSAGQIGTLVGQSIALSQTQREIVASSDLYYDNLIDIARAKYAETKSAEDLKALNDLIAKKESDRVALLKQGQANTNAMVDAYNKVPASQDAIIDGLKAQAELLYKDTPFAAAATETLDKLKNLDLGGQELVLAANVASGDIPVDVMSTLLSGSTQAIQKQVGLIITSQGSQTGLEAIQLMNQFPGNEKIQKDISLRVQEGNIDILNFLNRLPDKTALEFYVSRPKALERLENTFDKINDLAANKDLNAETVIEEKIILDSTALAEFKTNQAYFDSLPEESRKVYLQSFITTYSTATEEDVQSFINRKISEAGGMSGGGKYIALQYSGDKGKAKAKADLASETSKDLADAYQATNDALGGTPEKPGGGDGGGKKKSGLQEFLDGLRKDLKLFNNSAITAKSTIAELLKASEKFSGVTQKLRFRGASSEFIDAVMDMDGKTRATFVKIENGVVTITEKGRQLQQIFANRTMGGFVDSLIEGTQTANNQAKAFGMLREAGLSVEDAYDTIQDGELANAIAIGATSAQIAEQIEWIKRRKAADLKFQLTTPKGVQQFISDYVGKVEEGTGVVGQFFEAQERLANAKFETATANLRNDVRLAETDIQLYRDTIDDLEFQLSGVQTKEDAINEKYDKRAEALDRIWKANSDIAKQQQDQLDIVSALASGDLAAAAQAMRQTQANRAAKAKEDQEKVLELARQKELEKVTGTGGKTRKQLEEEIKKTQGDIAKIEEERLEPAQKLIRAQEKIRDDALAAIAKNGYLNVTKEGWNLIAAEAGNAAANSDRFKASLEEIIKLIPGLKITSGTASFDAAAFVGSMNATANAAETAPEDVAPIDPKVARIAALNTLIAQNRATVQSSPGNTAADAKLMKTNIDLIKELRILTGDPNAGKPVKKAMGGMIAKKFAVGGFAMGTDIVPAMLTPGEFVVRKYAVDKFGVDNLKAINDGTYKGDSVYNYEVNVNVKSDANPDQIARAVMTQLKQIDAQRIRSNRY